MVKDPSSPSPSPNAKAGEAENRGEAPAGAAPARILLVEDNQTDVYVMVEALRESGIQYSVEVATDGERARAILGLAESDGESGSEQEALCPQLILLDLNLPKLSGIELLSQLRGSSRHRHIPVVIVTSSDSEQDREAARALNASAYFRKPSSLSGFMELAALIRETLRGNTGPDTV